LTGRQARGLQRTCSARLRPARPANLRQSAELYPIFADLSLNRFANVPLADCLKLAAELLDRILLRGERRQIGKKGSALS